MILPWKDVKKPVQQIQHLSFSSMWLFNSCPYSWYNRYVNKVVDAPGQAADFGNNFERALAEKFGCVMKTPAIHSPEIDAAVASYSPYFEKWLAGDPFSYQEELRITPERWEEVADSLGVNPYMPYPIKGFIDFRLQGMRNEITDTKTGTAASYQPKWTIQQAFYAAFTGATVFNIDHVHSKTYAVVPHRKPVTKQMLQESLNVLAHIAHSIEKVMKDPEYLPRLAGDHCRWCSLKSSHVNGEPECLAGGDA